VGGEAGAVLGRKDAAAPAAAEHSPGAVREFRFDAAELRVRIHDLSHFAVPFETLGYRRLPTEPIGQNPVRAFQKPERDSGPLACFNAISAPGMTAAP